MSEPNKRPTTGQGYGFGFAPRLADGIEKLRIENARRVKCSHCALRILPENMSEHVRICHSDD